MNIDVNVCMVTVLMHGRLMFFAITTSSFSGICILILVVECASLPNPANGVVTVTGLTPGSVATYICDDSYQLIGGDTRTCNSNGLWTNLEPFCIRKCFVGVSRRYKMLTVFVCV